MPLPRFRSWVFRRRNASSDWTREPEFLATPDDYLAARKAHKPRRPIVDRKYNERHRRMRLQKEQGLFGEVASVATLFVGGYGSYCIVNPLDADAAELAIPLRHAADSDLVIALLVLAVGVFLAGLIGVAAYASRSLPPIEPTAGDEREWRL